MVEKVKSCIRIMRYADYKPRINEVYLHILLTAVWITTVAPEAAFVERAQVIRSPRKKRGGGSGEGPALGPILKSLHRGPQKKGGGSDPSIETWRSRASLISAIIIPFA